MSKLPKTKREKTKGPKHDSHNMSKLPKTKREKTKGPKHDSHNMSKLQKTKREKNKKQNNTKERKFITEKYHDILEYLFYINQDKLIIS
jgi:hypothetical protein